MDLHIQLIQKISRFLARIQPASIFVPFQNGFLTFKCTMLPSYHECIVVLQDWHTFIPGSYLQFSLDALSFTMMLLGNCPPPRSNYHNISLNISYVLISVQDRCPMISNKSHAKTPMTMAGSSCKEGDLSQSKQLPSNLTLSFPIITDY